MKKTLLSIIAVPLIACGGGTDPIAAVATLTVTPSAALLDTLFSIGQTVQLSVVASDANGYAITNAPIAYSSASSSIVKVSNAGLLESVGNGTTTITISSGGVSAQRTVPVRQKFASLVINPSAFSMVVGTNRTVGAQARDALGRGITALTGATFTATNTGIATVGLTTGLVQAVALGTTSLSATLTSGDGTRNATATVTIVATFPSAATVILESASFNPTESDISAGGTVTFNNTSGTTHNVTFVSGAANIPDHPSGSNIRTFASAGTFEFSCTIHSGMAGRVIVH